VTDRFNPVQTAGEIAATYRRYLRSLIAAHDPRIGMPLATAIDRSPLLHKGPYLEATPPYVPGLTPSQLVREGVLDRGFEALGSPALPLERPLYRHQEQAIRKVRAGRNVVIATGTGSGKTESFLLPILDSLVRERAAGSLGPGVRALLLYPMNALANDQMKRLRSLLAGFPAITFGRYTGDTENDPRVARDTFAALNPGEPLLPNELVSRREMQQTPPHLLLTNYAMLEYLLLRPQDMTLFPEAGEPTWRFLVVDEAHVYDGTQGAELAMLMRRLRDRVVPDGQLQCIATSATVGADTDPKGVTDFASSLFGVPFEWVTTAAARQDLVVADRLPSPRGPFWGPLTAADYRALADAEPVDAAVLAHATAHGWLGQSAAEALVHEERLADLKRALRGGPRLFDQLVDEVFPGDPDGREALVSLVAVASRLHGGDGSPALSARYHLFLRATEGAFTCLSDTGPHVHLARHERCEVCDAAVFEVGACRRCGAVHLIGVVEPHDGFPVLGQRQREKRTSWLALDASGGHLDDDDESVLAGAADDLAADPAMLCSRCGALSAADAKTCQNPSCKGADLRRVARLKKGGQELTGCLICGARGEGTVRAFETGADAAGAVIATTLYQKLPASAVPQEVLRPGEGRKLLMFSDSRQAAAYFAPYLEDTYGRLQRRRLVHRGLVRAGATGEAVFADDVVAATRAEAAAVRFFERRTSRQEQDRIIAPWVMAETVSTDDRQSLEGVGLLRISLDRDPAWAPPAPLLSLGLTADECWDFLGELVRTLRNQGAVTMPDAVAPNDEIFSPRRGPIYARLQGPEPKHKVLAWLPGRGTNRRVDYAARVIAALGISIDPGSLLSGVWTFLTGGSVDWLARSVPRGLGEVRQVDHRALRYQLVTSETPVFVCGTCQRVAAASVRGVCPAIGCPGRLQPFAPPPIEGETDHYRAIYQDMHPVSLKAMEHTAQWRNTEAATIQQQFIRGEVNALSCSTTFELGVDVGELQAVLLRNVPPTTANYVQRAGRAGRRAGAAALVVTYAQRRSHDLTHFAEPTGMMAGTVRPPYVPLANARIDRRHAYSVALSAFFRWYRETFGLISDDAGEFFLGEGNAAPAVESVRAFLTPAVPDRVKRSLERVLPPTVQAELGLAQDHWVADLLDLLEQVRLEMSQDVASLQQLQDDAVALKRFGQAERLQKVMRTIKQRDLLGFLANHNVIPKYGFPVDTVELRTNIGAGSQVGSRLELSRDLTQAIHEYAPDATLVAGGFLWTARGVYRLPGRDLERLQYRVCESCGQYWEALQDIEPKCPHCGRVSDHTGREFIIPEFGFVAAPEPSRPGSRPPERAWGGATYVARLSEELRTRTLALPGGAIEASVGPRGRLVAVADGPGGAGYWVCDWCGWGTAVGRGGRPPRQHDHLLRPGTQCNGRLSHLDLAHRYETDLLSLDLRPNTPVTDDRAWKSTLYAVLEAASATLQIARDDIGGVVGASGPLSRSLMLFDAVPGGGGNVLRIEEHLEHVLSAALRRVDDCECGPETSCYGCLRGYRNQRDHEALTRGAAADLLRSLGVTR